MSVYFNRNEAVDYIDLSSPHAATLRLASESLSETRVCPNDPDSPRGMLIPSLASRTN
jgi:hypothetical protein